MDVLSSPKSFDEVTDATAVVSAVGAVTLEDDDDDDDEDDEDYSGWTTEFHHRGGVRPPPQSRDLGHPGHVEADQDDDDDDDDDDAPELLDMDKFLSDPAQSTNRRNNDHDTASHAGGISISGMSRVSQLSYAEAEQRARERVRRHLEENKRKSSKKGAFKTRNSNKSYAKGKRVVNDFGL
mmetsp:Transcript_12032/g.22648  ORF Transcript_12032/g.22648 Transcript_12032/m.22648 type:complete len:181 (+) Transcript_12032:94-636(+)